jgi:transcriptional regulator GlxA family with amidase domain
LALRHDTFVLTTVNSKFKKTFKMKIVILLYKGFTAMDAIGAYEILCRLPEADVRFAAKSKGIIESEYAGMKMIATHNLDEIQAADILLVPGSTFAFTQVAQDKEVLQHIQRIDQTTKWTVSVCTGAIILGAAGLLKEKRATTHWAVLDRLPAFGALPKSERYVQDGKLITAAGVSAGIDMALFLTTLIAGEDYAKMVQLVTEYYPAPPVNIPDITAVPEQIEAATKEFLKNEILKMSSAEVVLN